MRRLLQRDSSFALPEEHSAPFSYACTEIYDGPVHVYVEKHVMRQPGYFIALRYGHSAPSSGATEKTARGLTDDKCGTPVAANTEYCALACHT